MLEIPCDQPIPEEPPPRRPRYQTNRKTKTVHLSPVKRQNSPSGNVVTKSQGRRTKTKQVKSRSNHSETSHGARAEVNQVGESVPLGPTFACDEQLALQRIARIEKNYATIDTILSSLEAKLDDSQSNLAEPVDASFIPKHPR